MKKYLLLLAFIVLTFTSKTRLQQDIKDSEIEFNPIAQEQEISTYEIASNITGCPVYILEGIAFAESSGDQFAIGDDGISIGRFQINETYHEYYASLYGEYNPYCPLDSAILTGRIYMDNLKALGSVEDAIAAHRQGRTGVRKNGRTQWYVDRVLNYSKSTLEESWNIDI